MCEGDLNRTSETDWKRVDALTDADIDVSDIPPLDEAFFAHARLYMPGNKMHVVMNEDGGMAE